MDASRDLVTPPTPKERLAIALVAFAIVAVVIISNAYSPQRVPSGDLKIEVVRVVATGDNNTYFLTTRRGGKLETRRYTIANVIMDVRDEEPMRIEQRAFLGPMYKAYLESRIFLHVHKATDIERPHVEREK